MARCSATAGITPPASASASTLPRRSGKPRPAAPSVPILQTFLPPEVDLQGLATYLRGKWFGPLRWYGLMETPEELTLSWLSEDDAIQLDARLRTGALAIEAHLSEPSQFPAATVAAHELFQHIAQAYGRVRMNG